MTDPTPTEELRAAADKLRALKAAIAEPGLPWHTEECDEPGNCPCIVAQGHTSYHDEPSVPMRYVADAETPEHAAYIAAMHPGVGSALADWLTQTADLTAAVTSHLPDAATEEAPWLARALTVARAINGGAS